jgi:uncharacterized membrane protein YccC
LCAKVALAAVAAYGLTLGGRNDYALYSVMSAALVVGGSVGEDLNASFNRVRGTLAGAIVGSALAYALEMTVWSLGIGVAALAWLSIGLGWGTPAVRAGIAMTLVVLFTHADANDVGWRVVNTLIGVSVGVAVSRFVWPVRGRDEVAGAIDRTLAASAAALEALARDTSSHMLVPLQLEVLDALTAMRTARLNARRAQQLERNADLLSGPTLLAVRAAIDTLGASLRLDEVVHAGARAECLDAVRRVIASLAAHAKDAAGAEPAAADFAHLHQAALREAAHPDIGAGTRVLVVGLLSELQQIHAALQGMRDDDSNA